MDRRQFIVTASSSAMVAILPSIARPAVALPAAPARAFKWFAVGHDDEFCYPIRAANMAEAIDEYANEHGHTKGDYCPECEEVNCTKHLDPAQWNQPHDFIEECSSQPKQWDGLESEPTSVEWLRAGFNVRCEGPFCEDNLGYWETQECWEHAGKALCEECLDAARSNINAKEGQADGA